MDGWRDGSSRLWWNGVVTTPSRPAEYFSTAKNDRPAAALEKNTTVPSRLTSNLQPPRSAKTNIMANAPFFHEKQIQPLRSAAENKLFFVRVLLAIDWLY